MLPHAAFAIPPNELEGNGLGPEAISERLLEYAATNQWPKATRYPCGFQPCIIYRFARSTDAPLPLIYAKTDSGNCRVGTEHDLDWPARHGPTIAVMSNKATSLRSWFFLGKSL